jgi:hypothetical protein
MAAYAGYTAGPIGGLTVGFYATGIEKAATTGTELEYQMRNYFSPNTKGNFWRKFYW